MSRKGVILLVIIAFLFSLGLRLIHLKRGWERYHTLFFYEGRPLLVGMDGYYYLRLTRDYLSGNYKPVDELREGAKRPSPPPLIVVLTAALHKVTGIHIEWLAFFLPPVLASFLVLPLFLWGQRFGGAWAGFLAALLGSSCYYWYTRTPLGRFDTDCLLLFFVLLIPYLIYHFCQEIKVKKRLLYLLLALITAFLFVWWWPPGKTIIIPFLLVTYAASIFISPQPRIEKYLKIVIFLFCLVYASFVFIGPPEIFPAWLKRLFITSQGFLKLIGGRGADIDLPVFISELAPPDFSFVVNRLAGHFILLIISALGFVLLIKERWRDLLFLIVPLVMAALSILGKRFLLYAVPFYAWGLAYFWQIIRPYSVKIPRINAWQRYALSLVIMALVLTVLVVNAKQSFIKTIPPLFNKMHVQLAEQIRLKTPKDTLIWCWWSYGYMLQYYAERKTIADGGNQEPLRLVITALPLATNNWKLAQNWIRFFAEKDIHGLQILKKKLHTYPKALECLKKILSQPSVSKPLLSKYGLDPRKWYRFFQTHKKETVMYLPYQMLGKVSWCRYGTWTGGTLPKAMGQFLTKDYLFKEEKGLLLIKKKQETYKIRTAFYIYFNPFPDIMYTKTYQGPKREYYLFKMLQVPFAYLVDKKVKESLVTQLLFFKTKETIGSEVPPKLLSFIPLQGGVWAF